MPVLSPKWAAARPFDSVMQDPPLTSGPYLVKRVDWGKTITFQRNPQYWGADLPVRRGQFNFQRITFKYFKDDTARLEGFKAGEFDWIAEYSAKNWARGHVGRHYRSGEIVKRQFKHSNAAGMQGFVLNTRRAQFADARVRKALALAFDFEWMNRQIFYGQYLRSPSYFTNSEMQAQGRPSDAELSLIRSLKERVQPKILSDEAPVPATTKAPESLRGNLRQAMALLSAAGWVVADDGRLRNAAGEAFEFEVLSGSKGSERIAVPWARNMEKLG
ncbi:MAG: ABC transporter substrate-binding protein, partial [Quisquiliibacterium sp.]